MVKSSLNVNFSLVTGVGTQESEDRSTKISVNNRSISVMFNPADPNGKKASPLSGEHRRTRLFGLLGMVLR
jgi:hypothetical protein